jgi:HlyD family secretion protein
VTEAQSKLRLAKISRDRYAALRQDGAVTQERLDQAETELETAQAILTARQAAVGAAQKQVESAQGALVQAQTTRFNPSIRSEQRAALRQQLEVAQAQLKVAQEQVAAANAARQQIQAQIAYLNVVSPINGVVTARSVEPGAVVTTGKTLLTVINPDTVYLRGFVPEGDIGKVRVGQAARVFLDSAPQHPLAARVTAIDTQASFTPENIYFRQDRVRQVFGVKLGIDQPAGLAKPGMPADAEILLDRAAAP